MMPEAITPTQVRAALRALRIMAADGPVNVTITETAVTIHPIDPETGALLSARMIPIEFEPPVSEPDPLAEPPTDGT